MNARTQNLGVKISRECRFERTFKRNIPTKTHTHIEGKSTQFYIYYIKRWQLTTSC